jgi:hypothetical protein
MTGEAYAFCIVGQNTVRMMKSRRMRWVGHVAYTGEMRNSYRILVGNPEEKRRPTSTLLSTVLRHPRSVFVPQSEKPSLTLK